VPLVIWLDAPAPLGPGSKLLVHGVTSDSPSRLISYWLELGRIADESLHSEPCYPDGA
jgi:hypothetical protein